MYNRLINSHVLWLISYGLGNSGFIRIVQLTDYMI